MYVTPKGWHKTRFCFSASKIQLLSKEFRRKVSVCEKFHRQSCSYIIPLSNSPWTIVGDVPIYLKFAL